MVRQNSTLAPTTARMGVLAARTPNHGPPRMNQDLSITSLVLHASVVVQIVMAGLLITSFFSWTVIFSKLIGLRKLRAYAFERGLGILHGAPALARAHHVLVEVEEHLARFLCVLAEELLLARELVHQILIACRHIAHPVRCRAAGRAVHV